MAGHAAAGWLIAAALAGTAAPPPPDRELLLFLAEFGGADDRYVDPAVVDHALDDARAPASRPVSRRADETARPALPRSPQGERHSDTEGTTDEPR